MRARDGGVEMGGEDGVTGEENKKQGPVSIPASPQTSRTNQQFNLSL